MHRSVGGEVNMIIRGSCRVLIWAASIVVLALWTATCHATDVVPMPIKQKGAGQLFRIHRGEKWGYVNRRGETAILPQFDDAGDFFSGLAKARKDQKWGYIDKVGRTVVGFRFDDAGDFSEGVAPVRAGRKWGFIDSGGRFAIEPQFQAAAEFSDGLARFEKWDTIECDSAGHNQEEPRSYTKEDAPPFAFRLHSRKPVASGGCYSRSARYGFVDKRGNVVIAPSFLVAEDFSEGLACVRPEQPPEPKFGYIDRTGRLVIQPRFDQAYSFSDGSAAVETGFRAEDGKKVAGTWGFISREGKFGITARFEMADSFSEGLAAVLVEGAGWGYVDGRGAFTIRPRYSQAGAFSEGLALVWGDEQTHGYYIDRRGKRALVLAPDLWPQWAFSDGLTIAGRAGEQWYVDRKGRIVTRYEAAPGNR